MGRTNPRADVGLFDGWRPREQVSRHRLNACEVMVSDQILQDIYREVSADQRPETSTLTGEATSRIRQLVLDGELEPNARINEVQLGDTLSISRTPLRAALQTLAGEGLLVYAANRGFTVRAYDLSEIIDAYEVRIFAEGLAARL